MDTFNPDDINPAILLEIEDVHREFTRLSILITSVRFLRHGVTIIGKKKNGTTCGVNIRFNNPNATPSAQYFNLPWFERLQVSPRPTRI